MPEKWTAFAARQGTRMRNCLAFAPSRQRGVCRYLLATLLIGLALLIRLGIAPVSAGLQYLTFFPAVALAAIAGGYRAGLCATLLGIAGATYVFTPPYYAFAVDDWPAAFLANMVFLLDGVIVSYAIELMHRYRQRHQQELAEIKAAQSQVMALNRELGALVAERQEADEQLRVAAAAFETREAILVTDAEARIIRVNRAFEEITGYRQEEVLGENPSMLSSGRHDQVFYAQMWQKILSTGSWNGELWDRHKNGHIYPKEMTVSAVKNAAGATTQYVAIFTDISERKKYEAEINNLAFYDALTALPNRRLLLDRLGLALAVSTRNRHYGAVLFLDMDKFKTLNDTLGHDYGDLLLVEVAKRLNYCVREVDTVARLGGDEFVVLLENISSDADDASQKVAHLAEKIRAILATAYRLKTRHYHSSPSIGVCLYYGNGETVDDLIRHADMAMYQAKYAGRNQVRFFDPAMQQAVESHAALEVDLRHAIGNRELQLHYQVQLDRAGRRIGAEALLRWTHPRRGMVSPAQFIPLAEESSLILDLGHWVLSTACQQLAAWRDNDLTRPLQLAINISAQQFKQPDFVDQVGAMLKKYGIDPARLKLELTESVALHDLDLVVAKMRLLREHLGVTLSLDDFGTGYSSLSYLKKLPLDQIKIDQSFVRDITTDANDAVMVKAIIDMARNFGLEVIAEGVETQAQLDFLSSHGCQAFQGYLFSKPLPAPAFEALLQAG